MKISDLMKIRLDSYEQKIENEYYLKIHINKCEYECEY